MSKQTYIAALLQERKHYEIHGPAERVDEVNTQLTALGHEAKPRAKRAEKRHTSKQAETR